MDDDSEWLKLLPLRARAVYSALCLAAYLRRRGIECPYANALVAALFKGCSAEDIGEWNDEVCGVHRQCVIAIPKHKAIYDLAVDACLGNLFSGFNTEYTHTPLIALYRIVRDLQCAPVLSDLTLPSRNADDEWGGPCDLSCYIKIPGGVQ